MFSSLKAFRSNKKFHNIYLKILAPEFQKHFEDAINLINNLSGLELGVTKPKILKKKYIHSKIDKDTFLKHSLKNVGIVHAEAHRGNILEYLTQTNNQAQWLQQLSKIYPSNVQNKLNKMFISLNNGSTFHLYSTSALIEIITSPLIFLKWALSITYEDRKNKGWLMPKDLKNNLDEWLKNTKLEIDRIENAIAWVLIMRLEIAYAKGIINYDDSIYYPLHYLNAHGLNTSINLVPKYLKTKNCSLSLNIWHERQEMSLENHAKTFSFLQTQSQRSVVNRFKALPIFKNKTNKAKIKNFYLNTLNLKCNDKIQVVPEQLKNFIPKNTKFLPKLIFKGTHFRAEFFPRYTSIITLLKIPLKEFDLIQLNQLEAKKLIHHPLLKKLMDQRMILIEIIQQIEKEYNKLRWWQTTSKKMVRIFINILQQKLKDTVAHEAELILAINNTLKNKTSILPHAEVNHLILTFKELNHHYNQCQIQKNKFLEEKETNEKLKTLTFIQDYIYKIKDILEDPDTQININNLIKQEIEYNNKITKVTEKLLKDKYNLITELGLHSYEQLKKLLNPESELPQTTLYTLSESHKIKLMNNHPLQKKLGKLLNIITLKAVNLKYQKEIFYAIFSLLAELYRQLLGPAHTLNSLLNLSPKPYMCSLDLKIKLIDELSDSLHKLQIECMSHKNFYQEQLLMAIHYNHQIIKFYNLFYFLHSKLIEYFKNNTTQRKCIENWALNLNEAKEGAIEKTYELIEHMAMHLIKWIEQHNLWIKNLNSYFFYLKPQICSLTKSITAFNLQDNYFILDKCIKSLNQLNQKPIEEFSLPNKIVSKFNAIKLPTALNFHHLFNINLPTQGKVYLYEESFTPIILQASNNIKQLIPVFLGNFNISKEHEPKHKLNTGSLCKEIIRLIYIINKWGNKKDAMELLLLSYKVYGVYCNLWLSNDLNPNNSRMMYYLHQKSKILEKLLNNFDLNNSFLMLFNLRIKIIDVNSWIIFAENCRKLQNEIIKNYFILLKMKINILIDHGLDKLCTKNQCGQNYFINIIEEMINLNTASLTNPKLKLSTSDLLIFGLEPLRPSLFSKFFNQVQPEKISMESKIYLESCASFKLILKKMEEVFAIKIHELETIEFEIDNILSKLPNTFFDSNLNHKLTNIYNFIISTKDEEHLNKKDNELVQYTI